MDHPNLKAIAEQAMRERGFLVKSPPEAIEQLKTETEPPLDSLKVVDLSSWLWSSIETMNPGTSIRSNMQKKKQAEQGSMSASRRWIGLLH